MKDGKEHRKIIIIGAGPAGLTTAYELLSNNREKFEVIVLEESNFIGGISKTVVYNGNRMDIGGHRFFSKSKRVNDWWEKFLPVQGKKSYDDIMLNKEINISKEGPDPEKCDNVMLIRHRISRILFSGKFYEYPISLKLKTLKNMGLINTLKCLLSYLGSLVHKLPENNLENFYINRFGKKLYKLFFEYYTFNLWGRHPREIDASWGYQRIKGVSISVIIKNALFKLLCLSDKKVETSLIEEFKYPKLGPGELWEVVAKEIVKLGAKIQLNSKVIGVEKHNDKIVSVKYVNNKNEFSSIYDISCVVSSMPVKDLITSMNDTPKLIAEISDKLPYRDYITVGVLLKRICFENNTSYKTIGNIIPDNWIYVQDKNVKLGRVQIYNNWSPYMVKDINNSIWVGLEYFVDEKDEYWNMSEEEFTKFAISEIIKIKLINDSGDVIDTHVEKVKKAYPAYFDTYNKFYLIKEYLDKIENLYCVGRNGQHRYNNIDHSMLTAFETVDCILNNKSDKSKIWSVNTEKEYHES